ncbi:hypothetical protein HIM_06082 [Hirsutella minnesotensis 3608]|uniref:Protein LOT5 n=1 Tax=Hirsutella minnesotensis 3608 TaxID=1043627 RepID=A0A0F7ZJK1_9HYPO|nr:hypothetical protein HIM_06082 [Hirsutella minnesotensis 3608]
MGPVSIRMTAGVHSDFLSPSSMNLEASTRNYPRVKSTMLATTIRSPPAIGDYIPLADYQAQTPESFTDGKPVLHFHVEGATALIPKSSCGSLAIFPADMAATADGSQDSNGEAEDVTAEQKVDVFVTSEVFTVFSHQAQAGVSIPYPSISIHAIKQVTGHGEGNSSQAVWMQLELSDGGANDNDFDTIELTIIPTSGAPDAEGNVTQQLFDAVSACSELHPDPADGEDDDDEYDRIVFESSAEHEALDGFTGVLRGSASGGLPPPMPGSGGWITADNVHEFFDEEGNFLGRNGEADENPDAEADGSGELGEGAGRIRGREELEPEGVNGHGTEATQDNKRPRVDE